LLVFDFFALFFVFLVFFAPLAFPILGLSDSVLLDDSSEVVSPEVVIDLAIPWE
jgi:hypothetical protein